MAERMSEAASQRVKALCAKVVVAHGLDEQIRRELCGHMEDELLAYLTGRQKLSEDDALILVEKHFGDPTVIRGLLRSVHCQDSGVSILHRLLGVAIVGAAYGVAIQLVYGAVGWIGGGGAMYIFNCFNFVAVALSTICLWGAYIWWTRRARSGHTPWFDRLPVGVLAVLFVVLVMLEQLAQWVALHVSTPTDPGGGFRTSTVVLIIACPLIALGSNAAAWAWWCDWPGFGTRRAVFGATAWAGWFVVHNVGISAAAHLVFNNPTGEVVTMPVWKVAAVSGVYSLLALAVGLALYWIVARFTWRARQAAVA